MNAPAFLSIRQLGKTFTVDRKPFTALTGFDLDIEPGELIAIVGSSGCGKSTLLRILIGLDKDYTGQILLAGKPLQGIGRDRAMVFQEHRLFPWLNVSQNIALGLAREPLNQQEKHQRINALIEIVGLNGFEQAYPHQLSGGMSQRVAIARGLVSNPEILLLDEPFGALDALTRRKMQEELLRIRERTGTTLLLVTHDVDEAAFLADRVVVMKSNPGQIEAVIPVALPHPRDRTSTAFHAISSQLVGLLTHTPATTHPES